LEHLIQTIRYSELVKRSIQKNLDQFLEEASQREDINQQTKEMKEDFKISRVEHQSKNCPRKSKGNGRKNSRKPPQPPRKQESTRKKRKRKARAVVTVETQEHTLQAETANLRTTVFKVWQLQSLCIMLQGYSATSRGI